MRILHILYHSLPLQSGYVFRTLGIVNQQRALGWEPVVLMSGKHYAPGPARERIGHEYIPADKSLGCRGNSGSVMPIPSSHGPPSGHNYGSVPPLGRRGPGVVSWTPKLRQVAKV